MAIVEILAAIGAAGVIIKKGSDVIKNVTSTDDYRKTNLKERKKLINLKIKTLKLSEKSNVLIGYAISIMDEIKDIVNKVQENGIELTDDEKTVFNQMAQCIQAYVGFLSTKRYAQRKLEKLLDALYESVNILRLKGGIPKDMLRRLDNGIHNLTILTNTGDLSIVDQMNDIIDNGGLDIRLPKESEFVKDPETGEFVLKDKDKFKDTKTVGDYLESAARSGMLDAVADISTTIGSFSAGSAAGVAQQAVNIASQSSQNINPAITQNNAITTDVSNTQQGQSNNDIDISKIVNTAGQIVQAVRNVQQQSTNPKRMQGQENIKVINEISSDGDTVIETDQGEYSIKSLDF